MEKVTGNYDPADISARTEKYVLSEKGQAMPSRVLPVTPEAFGARTGTEIIWLGGAGILLNVRGTAGSHPLGHGRLAGYDPLQRQSP